MGKQIVQHADRAVPVGVKHTGLGGDEGGDSGGSQQDPRSVQHDNRRRQRDRSGSVENAGQALASDRDQRSERRGNQIATGEVPTLERAFRGVVELLNARWSTDSGSIVELRLCEEPDDDRIHPFKKYQRRRGNRVGEIFKACIVEIDTGRIVYDGELMLAGWNDSSDKGQWVSFWLEENATIHPFHGFSRRTTEKLGCLFAVEIVVDNGPTARGGLGRRHAPMEPRAKRPLSSTAHLLVTGQRFVQFLTEKSKDTKIIEANGAAWTPERAKKYVKKLIGLESLSELDYNPGKAEAFREQIIKPYERWSGRDVE